MNSLIELVDLGEQLDTPEVHYYTAKYKSDDLSEFEKFISKHNNNEDIEEEFNDLLAWIEVKLGNNGADKNLFRHEKKAEALPPDAQYLDIKYKSNLRLYTIRICDHIVILLNGGIKTTNHPQKCPNVSSHFRFANQISSKLDEKFAEREIRVSDNLRDLIYSKYFEIIL